MQEVAKFEALEMNQVMKVEKMSNLALLLVLALCMSQPLITNASWFSQRYIVRIENRLSNQTLQAHCNSIDQDFGLQNISRGEQFQSEFYISYSSDIVYLCNLSWLGGELNFDAFNQQFNICEPWKWNPFKSKPYLNCVWRAQDDGIYLLDVPTRKYNLQKTWEHQ
jgi:hypothetical protein